MVPQQLLVLILGVCIIGIAVSAGFIIVQNDSYGDCRQAIYSEFTTLAKATREYRVRPYESDGGDGTFIGLTATPQGIAKLTQTSSTPFADFSIQASGTAQAVSILAIGKSPGLDVRKPVKMLMTVFPETTAIVVLN